MNTTLKTCFKCLIEKPLSEFYRHSEMSDGHLNKCKECAKADVYNYRHGNGRNKVLSYDRERAKTPERKLKAREIIKRWKEKYPERRSAQLKLAYAVKKGIVIPEPCICCGAKAEAHHPDYSAPLSVVWLCPEHHKQVHALTRIKP